MVSKTVEMTRSVNVKMGMVSLLANYIANFEIEKSNWLLNEVISEAILVLQLS